MPLSWMINKAPVMTLQTEAKLYLSKLYYDSSASMNTRNETYSSGCRVIIYIEIDISLTCLLEHFQSLSNKSLDN